MASRRPLHQLAAATNGEAARPLSARSDGSLRGRTARRERFVTSMRFSLRCPLTRLASQNTTASMTMTTARAPATTAKRRSMRPPPRRSPGPRFLRDRAGTGRPAGRRPAVSGPWRAARRRLIPVVRAENHRNGNDQQDDAAGDAGRTRGKVQEPGQQPAQDQRDDRHRRRGGEHFPDYTASGLCGHARSRLEERHQAIFGPMPISSSRKMSMTQVAVTDPNSMVSASGPVPAAPHPGRANPAVRRRREISPYDRSGIRLPERVPGPAGAAPARESLPASNSTGRLCYGAA
jgi:hypothetical protein